MTPLIAWLAVHLSPTVPRWDSPDWLNVSFMAAAFVGFVTQWGFSFVAARQSRRLNARTEAGLRKVQDLLHTVRATLVSTNAESLRLRDQMVEFAHAGLEPDVGAVDRGEPIVPDAPDALRDRVLAVLEANGDVLPVRAIYNIARPPALEQLLYVLYQLRDQEAVRWDDSRITWETRVRSSRA
ncbi:MULTISPECIES: hypothetical protein [Catenuloplanes]|uniref:Uncharacterized protein n=1 Tax=Catenuloplanes niger TaxID=587534 RepID=A0AAE3ZH03_9ACTN|nr:hypothetical protein [Catenuloplanes niger]MDR7319774.1 hypothetical protein [Catenuloplanes niger]